MIASIVWNTLFLSIIYITVCKEDSYEVNAMPVKHNPYLSNCNSMEDFDEEGGLKVGGKHQHSATCQEDLAQRNCTRHKHKYSVDVSMEGLPKHRPHVDFGAHKPKKWKKTKKHKIKKLVKVTEVDDSTAVPEINSQRKKMAKRRRAKMKKMKKVPGLDSRKPFDITVHIKMDEMEEE